MIPAHRRKRDPWRRAQLAPRVMQPMPDCRCAHPWRQHHPRDLDERGYCNGPRCSCLGYRPMEDR